VRAQIHTYIHPYTHAPGVVGEESHLVQASLVKCTCEDINAMTVICCLLGNTLVVLRAVSLCENGGNEESNQEEPTETALHRMTMVSIVME
jgi:hypothetical protein